MRRRGVLRRIGGGLALGALAGCAERGPSTVRKVPMGTHDEFTVRAAGPSDGATTPTPGIVATGLDYRAATDGSLVVLVPVVNKADSARTATVEVVVTSGGREYRQSRRVSLASGSFQSLRFRFDVALETVESDLDIEVQIGR